MLSKLGKIVIGFGFRIPGFKFEILITFASSN